MLRQLCRVLLIALGFSAKAEIPRLMPQDAYDIIQTRPVALIDVREVHEYGQGHIEDSINWPLSSLSESKIAKLQIFKEEGKDIILYCRSGHRSVIAATQFKKWGFEAPIVDIKGGILAWKNQGLPVVP